MFLRSIIRSIRRPIKTNIHDTIASVASVVPEANEYLRPGGVDKYRRPGGTDLYKRPA